MRILDAAVLEKKKQKVAYLGDFFHCFPKVQFCDFLSPILAGDLLALLHACTRASPERERKLIPDALLKELQTPVVAATRGLVGQLPGPDAVRPLLGTAGGWGEGGGGAGGK